MLFSELKQKEIINIKTCRCLGAVSDLCLDCKNGCILYLIVPGPGKLCCFLGRDSEYQIPWTSICQIGTDIILVDIDEEKCLSKDFSCPETKKAGVLHTRR